VFFSFFAMFYIKNSITNDSSSRSKYLRAPLAKNKHVQHVPIKHKQMSFVSNGGKFKLYTVPNGLLFSTPCYLFLPNYIFSLLVHKLSINCLLLNMMGKLYHHGYFKSANFSISSSPDKLNFPKYCPNFLM
jgi:hypothetical protein